MKGILALTIAGLLLLPVGDLSAQIRVDLKKKLNNEVNQRLNKRVDKAIDKTFDKVEKDVDSLLAGKEADGKEDMETGRRGDQETGRPGEVEKAQVSLNWNKFDFVPGTELIFEDDFSGEQNGEFPSRWDMTGGTMDMARFGDDMVVVFRNGNSNRPDAIMPYLTNRHEDYLPEAFTVEFDVYFSGKTEEISSYYLFLYDSKNQANIFKPIERMGIYWNRITFGNGFSTKYPGTDTGSSSSPGSFIGWRHISVSFNQRSLKTYMDDARLLNIPNCEFNPTGLMLSFHNPSGSRVGYLKNVRIAKGAVPLYDKFLVDGKFVTTGITFDVNKSTIKPESMGTLNYVVKMMKEHPELKFSVEGHTDGDGEEAFNQNLSEARSKAVVDQMIAMGIETSRLKSSGFGESHPMMANDTPENKAQNRRVEFVKM